MQESNAILSPDNASRGLFSQNDCKHLCRHAQPAITKLLAATEWPVLFSAFVCTCVCVSVDVNV